ncbi:hypothetical protein [Roseovarius aestuariivivens]|uniref:hypothetical protein n=1 Tax=Roseovarius aestuariivivens TaxID=1888910 RepID=UPI001081CEC0|nr:hypothetical protein [Roseovarius aestuariivivens]
MKVFMMGAALCLAMPAVAQDFSAGSEANSWGLAGEVPARFDATVVDILCELSGDCPEVCGGGARQLGLVRSADDVLVFPNKNGQPLFTGAVQELLPYCGQEVEVDGLMIVDEALGAQNIYQLQTIRAKGESEWVKANRWTQVWAEENPEAAGEGEWFRRDPQVNALIEKEGYLGLGLEVDEAFIADWF